MNLLQFEPRRRLALGLALIAASISGAAWSQASKDVDASLAPVVVAQTSGTTQAQPGAAVDADAIPVHLRGVRAAASQGPDALRRYIFRTRMIYNFYYIDFAPKE